MIWPEILVREGRRRLEAAKWPQRVGGMLPNCQKQHKTNNNTKNNTQTKNPNKNPSSKSTLRQCSQLRAACTSWARHRAPLPDLPQPGKAATCEYCECPLPDVKLPGLGNQCFGLGAGRTFVSIHQLSNGFNLDGALGSACLSNE